MREAGMITQKEYDRIVERSQPQTTTVTTGGGGGGANTAAIEAQIAQVSAQMAASTIVAPIAGTVTAIYNEDRQMADCRSSVHDDSTIYTDGSISQHPS